MSPSITGSLPHAPSDLSLDPARRGLAGKCGNRTGTDTDTRPGYRGDTRTPQLGTFGIELSNRDLRHFRRELKRARELRPVVEAADFLLDTLFGLLANPSPSLLHRP